MNKNSSNYYTVTTLRRHRQKMVLFLYQKTPSALLPRRISLPFCLCIAVLQFCSIFLFAALQPQTTGLKLPPQHSATLCFPPWEYGSGSPRTLQFPDAARSPHFRSGMRTPAGNLLRHKSAFPPDELHTPAVLRPSVLLPPPADHPCEKMEVGRQLPL